MAKHLTQTPSGTRAQIRINGELHRKHFPTGTDPRLIKEWLLNTELIYRKSFRRRSGRFSDDAEAYLAAVSAMPTYLQRKAHIEAWVAVFGPIWRSNITAPAIAAQLHTWRQTLSAASVNKRRTALMHLFHVLDGKAAHNPVKDTPRFAEPTPAPRAIPYPIIRQVFAKMPPSKSKARLLVMAYTGLTPTQIMAITPGDVDLKARTLAVVGRRKGRGTQGRVHPLLPAAVKAFRMMAREEAWGRFTLPPMRRAWQRACKAALGHADSVPYDLRHSFGTQVYRMSGDIRATQALMGHSTPQLTNRYTLAAVDPRMLAALKRWR